MASSHTSQQQSSITYLSFNQTTQKRFIHYQLNLAKSEYEQVGPRIKDALKRVKAYYDKQDLLFEYEIQALTTDNVLNIKAFIFYNKKQSVVSLSELSTLSERIEFFSQLLEHVNSLKENQIEPAMINLNPGSLIKAGSAQVILSDFLLPVNQLSSDASGLSQWYLGQLSPEQLSKGVCTKQSLVWQLGCLLYYLLTSKWPFLPSSTNSSHGLIGPTRRNIMIQKFAAYNDPVIQKEIFSKIFVELDDAADVAVRLTLEQLREATGALLTSNKPFKQLQLVSSGGSAIDTRKKFGGDSSQEEEEVIEEDEYYDSDERSHRQTQTRQQEGKKPTGLKQMQGSQHFSVQEVNSVRQSNGLQSPSDNESEDKHHSKTKPQHIEDYVPNPGFLKYHPTKDMKHSRNSVDSYSAPDDDSHHQSEVPAFDKLPSMNSSMVSSKHSSKAAKEAIDFYNHNVSTSSKNKKITQNKKEKEAAAVEEFNKLQSFRSSQTSGAGGGDESRMSRSQLKSESSFDQAQSYKIQIMGKGGIINAQKTGNKNIQEVDPQEVKARGKLNESQTSNQSKNQSQQNKSFSELNKLNLQNLNKLPSQPQIKADQKNYKKVKKESDIPISFLNSGRNSEKSKGQSNASHSQFGGEFADDQSSIHQNQESEQNLDDQIGFVVVISETQAIGITIDTAQFILFTFEGNKKAVHQVLHPKNEEQPIMGLKQVVSVKSVLPNQKFIVATTESTVNVYQLDHQYKVQLQLMKQTKLAADCICQSFEEPCFYVACQNKIGKAFIDPEKDQKMLISKKKLQFYENDQVKVTAMCYTIMKEFPDDRSDGSKNSNINGLIDGYIAIATSDFSFIILKISGKQGKQEVIAHIQNVHESDITQVLALTDFCHSLSFVTLSLDTQIKIFSSEGQLEHHEVSEGQIITGAVVPQRSKDYYLVSTFNEERNQNLVGVYRKQKLQFNLGPYDDGTMILDLKMLGNKLFIPKGSTNLERQELKGL